MPLAAEKAMMYPASMIGAPPLGVSARLHSEPAAAEGGAVQPIAEEEPHCAEPMSTARNPSGTSMPTIAALTIAVATSVTALSRASVPMPMILPNISDGSERRQQHLDERR